VTLPGNIIEALRRAGGGPCTTAQVAIQVGLDRGAAGAALRQLELDRLVRQVRSPSAGDGKAWKLMPAKVAA
jgi:DNA-binding IclR family transcriptional regulator